MKQFVRFALGCIFLLASTVGFAQDPAPIAQWHFDDGVATPPPLIATDSIGGSDGRLIADTPSGVPTWVSGVSGTALHFNRNLDGSSLVEVDGSNLTPQRVSIELWFRRNGQPTNYTYLMTRRVAWALLTENNGGLGWVLWSSAGAGIWSCQVFAPGTKPAGACGIERNLWDGQWHKMRMTWDGITLHSYFDGDEVGPGSSLGYPVELGYDYRYYDTSSGYRYTYPYIYIGGFLPDCRSGTCFPGFGDFNFDGDIDEVTIWDDAISPQPEPAPPTIVVPEAAGAEATGPDGAVVTYSVTATSSAGAPLLSTCDHPSGSMFPIGTTTVTCSTQDAGFTASASFAVAVRDTTAPTLSVPADFTIDATNPSGASVRFSASATDIVDGSEPVVCSPASESLLAIGTTTVTCTATDARNNSTSGQFAVTVRVTPPAIIGITGPSAPQPVGSSVTVAVEFADAGAHDSHGVTVDWQDGTTSAATVIESPNGGSALASHAYSSAGVYTISIIVTDNTALVASATYQYAVVYDPNGGFVSGGGWIFSPSGAYPANPTLTGKATFGFVSRYQRGATIPTGNTEFQFRVANLDFHSTSYDWLVIAGARAQYKGTGILNGVGGYGFLLTAIDGAVAGGGEIDKFRMKIWDATSGAIVYDNMNGTADSADPATVLGGGEIVIHNK